MIFLLLILWPTSVAHAGVPLGEELGPGGKSYNLIVGGWKLVLGLANVFVILVLLFLAIVNIAHINYDTYQIKKSLPLLIIGVVMANFSFLICRMFISSADILTYTFTQGAATTKILWPLVWNLGLTQAGIAAILLGTVLAFFTAGIGIGILILGFLLVLLPFIVLLVLWFILWIRVAALYLLIVLAPLAFVCLAFPPTMTVFKQWWSNFIKWVYMLPILYFILWLAVQISQSAKAAGDFSLSLWVMTLALSYFAFTVPFQLGGAVMGAWGKFGTWLGKQGAGLAQYGMEKKFGWSPRSQIEATKLGWKRSADRASTLAIAKSRGSQYYQAAKDALAAQRYDEEVAKPLGTSRTAFQRGFKDSFFNKYDPDVLQGLVGRAQHEGMFDDVLDGISDDKDVRSKLIDMATDRDDETRKRNDEIRKREENLPEDQKSRPESLLDLAEGDLDSDKIKDNGVRSKILKTIFGTDQEGLRLVNRQQEEATLGGNYTAMDTFWDVENEQFVTYDRDNEDDLDKISNWWIKRFQSPDPWKSMPNLRKESFTNKRVFKKLLEDGMLTQAHINNLFRARASTIESLTSDDYLGTIYEVSQQSTPGGVLAKSILQEMANPKRKLIPEGWDLAPTEVRINDNIMPIAAVPISITPEVRQQIQDQIALRVPKFTFETLQGVKAQVDANPAFSPEFKTDLSVQTGWEAIRNNLEKVSARTIDEIEKQAKPQMDVLINRIKTNLGTDLNSGLDISGKIDKIISSIPPLRLSKNSEETLRDQYRKKIREAIGQSQTPIITPGGHPLVAQQIIQCYEEAKSNQADKPINIRLEDTLEKAAGVRVDAKQLDKAWDVLEAYFGKEVKKVRPISVATAPTPTQPPAPAESSNEEEIGPE